MHSVLRTGLAHASSSTTAAAAAASSPTVRESLKVELLLPLMLLSVSVTGGGAGCRQLTSPSASCDDEVCDDRQIAE